MLVQVKKFGSTLISRPSGKEALLAFLPTLNELNDTEELLIDFKDVIVLTPSWLDEFLTPLIKAENKHIKLVNLSNPSVKTSLEILSKQHGIDFFSFKSDIT